MRKILYLLLLSVCSYSFAQTSADSVKVIPGERYEAGFLHTLFFGSHWRDLWTAPVTVPYLDIDKYEGGLTPTKIGGGLQTKSLRFKNPQGREFKFRSVDKDPKKALEKQVPALKGTIAEDIVQDQISSSHPYSPVIAYHLLKSVGINTFEPKFVKMKDNPRLGKYENEFKDLLGYIEEYPDESTIKNADKVISSPKLFERIAKHPEEHVNAAAFLAARLMDTYMGDWDRHKDQWKWVHYKDAIDTAKNKEEKKEEKEEKVDKKDKKDKKDNEDNEEEKDDDNSGRSMEWFPYPTDRDQAFSKFNGLIPTIAVSNLPQLNSFDMDYPDIMFLSWTPRNLDQRFLTFMDKKTWDSVTNHIYYSLTDAAINDALRSMPEYPYLLAKQEMTEKLISRRDQLKAVSDEFYNYVNKIVDVYTSDKDDYVEVDMNSSETKVTIYKKGKKGKGNVFIKSKKFDADITEEFRFYLQKGDDELVVKGQPNGTTIRVIGGKGKDEIINKTDDKVLVYDSGKKTKLKGDINLDDEKIKPPEDSVKAVYESIKNTLDTAQREVYEDKINDLMYDPLETDKGTLLYTHPLVSYSRDFGVLAGFGISWTTYGFRVQPYKSTHTFEIGYAFKQRPLDAIWVRYSSIFNDLFFKKFALNINGLKSGIEVNNFFGFGNETGYNDELYNIRYYRVNFSTYKLDIMGKYPRDTKFSVQPGVLAEHQRVNLEGNRYIDLLMPPGTEKSYSMVTPYMNIVYDGRDHEKSPLKGLYLILSGRATPSIVKGVGPYQRLVGDLRTYLYLNTFTDISLAFRGRAEKVFGKFPFYESAFLGGIKLLRGYPSERFAGDASVMGSSELRFKMFTLNFLLPEIFWGFAFAETGRVFLEGEKSKLWHSSYGGGLYISIVNRDLTISLTYATSPEKKSAFYLSTGFGF